jgi:hypothetical protein
MNLKINQHHIYIVIFASFFFLWGVNLGDFEYLRSFFGHPNNLILNKIKLSYFIIFLIIPIFYSLIGEKDLFLKEIFNRQKYIIFFTLSIIAHFFLVKVYYNEIIDKTEIANLGYVLLMSIIYCHYRHFIFVNFKKILFFYLIIFIGYSIFEGSQTFNKGQCNGDLFLIDMISKYLKISLTNSIYIENSHLAMMSIAVFFSCTFILVKEKEINILFLLLFLLEVIIVLNNLSTTYFVCYFFSQITLLLFFLKKLDTRFWIFTILLLSINSYLFFSDKHCTVKVTDFKVKDVIDENLEKGTTNLTTLIYKRSAILALHTLRDHSLGWGIDGMDNATAKLMSKYDTSPCRVTIDNVTKKYEDKNKTCDNSSRLISDYLAEDNKRASWKLVWLNMKDGLSNFFKMFTEFGVFTFIIFFYFLRYILNIKNIDVYNIFIIILFITLCIRGAGYFNGGFIFCLLEFFYSKKFFNELKLKEKH